MKKRILFVMSRMSIGGSQKSLVNVLKMIDYSKYDVTLYVRENKTDLISEVPETVRVVINTNPASYEYRPFALFLESMRRIAQLFHNEPLLEKVNCKSTAYVARKKTEYEQSHYNVFNEEFDIAISYLQGYTCKFTADSVKAKRMICFFHNSTDGTKELHSNYLPRYDNIVVMAEETRCFLEKRYPLIRHKVLVIQNIINVNEIIEKSKEYQAESNKVKPFLCTCGRISKEKGYDLAVEAAFILKNRGLSFTWFIIGDGSQRAETEKRITEQHLENEIVLLGALKNPYPWLKACDLYIQPSWEESQSLTIMEAFILDKPVVSTRTVGGKGNIESDRNGILTDFSGDSLADGIIRLICDKQLYDSMQDNISKTDYHRYNERIICQWKNLLEGVS